MSVGSNLAEEDDVIIGSATEALLDDGDEQAAALLLDVLGCRVSYYSDDPGATLVLCVPRWLHERFTDDVRRRILGAIAPPAHQPQGMTIVRVWFEAPLAEPGWRSRAVESLNQGPSNQGTIAPPPRGQQWITEDRMRFRDQAERAVYRALKRAQQALPNHESLTVLPNCAALARIGSTWEPDFVVAYKGRVGIIEVDGASHQGRAAADKTRGHFFEDSGMAYVDRGSSKTQRTMTRWTLMSQGSYNV
jgi:hypothetical protein